MQPLPLNNPTCSGIYSPSIPLSLSPNLRDGTREVRQAGSEAAPSPWQDTMLSSLVSHEQALGISFTDPKPGNPGTLFFQDQGDIPGLWCAPSSLHTKRDADKIKRTGFAQLEKDFDGS